MLTEQVKHCIREHSSKELPKESCGLIIQRENQYIAFPCRNMSKDTTTFTMHPFDFVSGSALGEIKAIYHSHTKTNQFSYKDGLETNLHNIPFVMYFPPNDEFKILNPFKLGINDCFTTVQNYFKNRGIFINNYERKEGWKTASPRIIEDNFKNEGFVEISLKDIREGDVILFKYKKDFAEHMGVYLGGNKLLHHPRKDAERIDGFDRHVKYAFMALRYGIE